MRNKGFTIVELLIVVVVIAILAAITIVAYNGIQERARLSSLQSELASAHKALESEKFKSGTETYPSSLSGAAIPTANTAYYYSSSDNSYCMTKTSGTIVYHVSSATGAPAVGACGENALAASWRLNGNTNDSVGTYNGVSALNVTQIAGQNTANPGGYQFNGTNSEINLPIPSIATTNVAVTAWVYMQNGTKGTIFHVGNNGGGYSLGIGDGFNSTNRRLTALFPGRRWILTTGYVSDGWHHVGISLSSDSTPSFFLDGELIAGGPYTGVTPTAPTNAVVLGRNTGDEGASATDRLFNGRIDDVRFYGRAITAAEAKGAFSVGSQ